MITFRDYRSVYGARNPYAGDYGIEIETQSPTPFEAPDIDGWANEPDGSIREYGLEYKLHRPVNYESVYDYLTTWKNALENAGIMDQLVYSKYCSIHVHINVSKMTLKEIANFVTTYFIIEEVFNEYCGPDRDGNIFCLKSSLVNQPVTTLNRFYKDLSSGEYREAMNTIEYLSEDNLKYNALGLASLRRRQSLEIRTHPCTYNIDEIFRWVSMINSMKEFSKTDINPDSIIHMFARGDVGETLHSLFGNNSRFFSSNNLQGLINKGLFNAIRMGDGVDWAVVDAVNADILNSQTRPIHEVFVDELEDGVDDEFDEDDLSPAPVVTNTYRNQMEEFMQAQEAARERLRMNAQYNSVQWQTYTAPPIAHSTPPTVSIEPDEDF